MRIFMITIILFCAAGLKAAPAENVQIRDGEDHTYIVEGSFIADVPVMLAWNVLSDYGHLSETVQNMVASRVLRDNGPDKLVEQTARGGFFIFHKTVTVRLQVKEQVPFQIDFTDLLKADFKLYNGSWKLEGAPDGVRVLYRLNVSRGAMASEAIERWIFKKEANSLLRELRLEIERRRTS